MSKKKKDWKTEKERLLSMGRDERRKEYRRQDFISLDRIPTWREENEAVDKEAGMEPTGRGRLSDKISLYKGDITVLEVDAIVNAANSGLLGGGGVDGCIHKAAGSCLHDECHSLNGCETGKAKITCGYDLPARYVIHTVGPVARGSVGPTETSDLTSCYQNSLRLMEENDLSTVAFPCISTGIYGFPNEPAADIALTTVKSWIEENPDKIKRVIFCVFLETDFNIYKNKMTVIFQDNDPKVTAEEQQQGKVETGGEEEDDNDVPQPDDVIMESQNPDEMSTNEEQIPEQSEMGNQGRDVDVDADNQKDSVEEKDVINNVAEKEQELPAQKEEIPSSTVEMEDVSEVNDFGTSNREEEIKDHVGSSEEPDSSPNDSIQSKDTVEKKE